MEKIQPTQVLFFDLDDTIIDWSIIVAHLLWQSHQELAKEGVIFETNDVPTDFTNKEEEETFIEAFGEKYWKIGKDRYYKKYIQHEYPMFSSVRGALDILNKLCYTQIPIAIVSNGSTKDIYAKLGSLAFDKSEIKALKLLKQEKDIISYIKNLLDNEKYRCNSNNKEKSLTLEILRYIINHQSKFVVIGYDQTKDRLTKPHPEMGFTALDKLHIQYKTNPVSVLHIGDKEKSDILFANNFNLELQKINNESKCTSILFMSSLDHKTLKDKEFEDVGQKLTTKSDTQVYGYGKIGNYIKNILNKGRQSVTLEAILEQRSKLGIGL